MLHSPVIVIGMHRSGTSAMMRALQTMGLFIGHDLEPNAEARYFLQLNEAMLSMIGARWDEPLPMLGVWEDKELIEWLSRWVEPAMSGYQTRLYLSKPGWMRHKDIRHYTGLWGWKDPRNTLTLPVWLKLFPNAKIIHVVRHGVDVAASLRYREQQLRKLTLDSDLYDTKSWKVTSIPCLDIVKGFKLWERYVESAEHQLAYLPKEQYKTIAFEDWLKHPIDHLNDLNRWLKLEATDNQLDQVIRGLKPGRGFAYRQQEDLITFEEQVHATSDVLQRLYP